jgi:hypothetical protein
MVLSEARGLWLFLVIREGIGCKWVTRCRGTQGRTVLTDTPLEPSISRTRPATTGENPRVESLLHRRCSSCLPMQVCGSKSAPFFHMVKVIVAILRARVRRAIVGRIPFSTRAT